AVLRHGARDGVAVDEDVLGTGDAGADVGGSGWESSLQPVMITPAASRTPTIRANAIAAEGTPE
ncbi:MAG TPA: hypothetical protein VE462_10330, partial [Propionibacteriaceae bacterium]|nr:hypothetical protein [Propionibacteriaceae bacterium]